jgi:hypothetical protein
MSSGSEAQGWRLLRLLFVRFLEMPAAPTGGDSVEWLLAPHL